MRFIHPARPSSADLLGAPGSLALGVVAGTALQLAQIDLWALPAYVAVLALVLPALAFVALQAGLGRCGRPRGRGLWLVLLGCGLAFALGGVRALHRQDDRLDGALWGQEVRLTGVVDAVPVRGPESLRFVLAVESAERRGEPVRVPQRIQLVMWRHGGEPDRLEVHVGERWRLDARLRPVHGLSNPHGGDRELQAWAMGIGAQGSVRPAARRLGLTGQYPLERWREALSMRLQVRLQEQGHGGVLAALAVGDQDAIPAGERH